MVLISLRFETYFLLPYLSTDRRSVLSSCLNLTIQRVEISDYGLTNPSPVADGVSTVAHPAASATVDLGGAARARVATYLGDAHGPDGPVGVGDEGGGDVNRRGETLSTWNVEGRWVGFVPPPLFLICGRTRKGLEEPFVWPYRARSLPSVSHHNRIVDVAVGP